MILSTLPNSARYEPLHPRLADAFGWLREADLTSLSPGRQEIDGDRLGANIIHAPGKTLGETRLEVHRRYADVQYLIAGAEQIGWRPTVECRQPVGEFDEAADLGFFADEPRAWYALTPGSFALFFPEDAHAPMLAEGELRKIVVKMLL